jgi:hypothetical protein
MPARSEVLGKRPICREKSLRVPGGLEPLHTPLPLAGRLMGVLRAVVEIPVLPMLHESAKATLQGHTCFDMQFGLDCEGVWRFVSGCILRIKVQKQTYCLPPQEHLNQSPCVVCEDVNHVRI